MGSGLMGLVAWRLRKGQPKTDASCSFSMSHLNWPRSPSSERGHLLFVNCLMNP
ncbi:MAG: hypothetical protein IH978_00685 [Nitrospinae bacterium]|nr:hypothetical protein [Nitrospinota bacterium]